MYLVTSQRCFRDTALQMWDNSGQTLSLKGDTSSLLEYLYMLSTFKKQFSKKCDHPEFIKHKLIKLIQHQYIVC